MPLYRLQAYRLQVALVLALVALVFPPGCNNTQVVSGPEELEEPQTVLLISLDGFRPDYLERYAAPTLTRLAAEGVRAEALIPSFPTKTFPNHYTLVTGLYPAHHGIVSNSMYDPVFDASFSLGNRAAVSDGRWWGGEPIWVTAENAGVKTAAFFWPGSEAEILGVRPSYWTPFDNSLPAETRIAQIIAWLELPAPERPRFLTLYFSDVDSQSHRHGLDAPQTAAAVAAVDGYLARLIEELEARDLYDRINLVVTSDHGMAATSQDRVVFLDDYLDLDAVRVVEWTPVLMLRPGAAGIEAVYDALAPVPHLSVYRAEDVPERFHFRGHRRIPAIIAMADDGWSITSRAFFERNPARFDGGDHGYDNALPSMQALFLARGPAFAEGLTVGPFANVHVYNLIMAILGLDPAPNDGDFDVVRPLLRPAVVAP